MIKFFNPIVLLIYVALRPVVGLFVVDLVVVDCLVVVNFDHCHLVTFLVVIVLLIVVILIMDCFC